LEGLDRFLALNPRPEVLELKRRYEDRAAHESRLRSAKEEFQAAEAALMAHGAPREPSAVVDEEILSDMDLRLERMRSARKKFRGEDDSGA
jgi:hypothetical protein